MKRNKHNIRAAKRTRTQSGQSRYAEKRARNEMMYGPGCCAHSVTQAQIEAGRRRAREEDGRSSSREYPLGSLSFPE